MSDHTNVIVNFNAEIDASGQIRVFGTTPTDISLNVIYPHVTLPVNALYDGSSALIEFFEPDNDLGNIHVKLASSPQFDVSNVPSYQYTSTILAKALQKILVDQFDCSSASPFDDPKYTNNIQYTTHREFGRVALSTYTHYLFGHVAATAAITNDVSFIQDMLSISDKGANNTTPLERYNAWNKLNMVHTSPVNSWNDAFGIGDANLAVRLVKTLVFKGIDSNSDFIVSNVNSIQDTSTDDSLANIVKQVIGQDATRAMGQDNNQLSPNESQLLRFFPGDKIAFNIRLPPPSIVIANSINPGAPSVAKYDKIENYAILITLSQSDPTLISS